MTRATPDLPSQERKGRRYMLGMIVAAGLFANIDRYAFFVILEPVKNDLNATDTQMGFLAGLAFVISYFVFGIPIARLADVGVRRTILSVSLIAWSVMTAACAMAGSVFQMALARSGLGIAESGGTPASLSMIADSYASEERHRAIGVFQSAAALAPILGVPAIAVLADQYGWRAALWVPAILGFLLGVIFLATVKEPERGRYDDATDESDVPSFLVCARLILSNKALVCHLVSHTFAFVYVGVVSIWFSSFLIRGSGFTVSEVGAVIGAAGLTSLAAILAGGWIGSYLVAKFHSNRTVAAYCALICLLMLPPAILWLVQPPVVILLASFLLANFIQYLRLAPTMTLATELSPPRARGLTVALLVGGSSLVGSGLAPMLVGWLSDVFAAGSMETSEAVGKALLYTVVPSLLLAAAFGFLSAYFISDSRKVAT